MAMQRIHDSTLNKLRKLAKSVNEQRVIEGEKKLTAPDVLDEAVDYLWSAHIKAKHELEKQQSKLK